jgi:type I restriction enzyme S subunit
MELVKLGEVAEILNGFAFKSDAFINQGTKVIRIGDINDNKVYKDNCVCIDEKTYSFPDLCRVKKDDVLMALSGATTGKIGIIDEELEGALVNQRIAIIRSQNQTTQKYIQYIFRGELLQKLLINAWGAAQPNLSSNALRSLEIPLPPIASQRRIANILDKADEIIRKRKEAIALTEQLQKSIFLDMFGDPVTNPKGWEVKRLEDVTTKITDGTHKTPQYVQEGILFLSAKNIKKHK